MRRILLNMSLFLFGAMSLAAAPITASPSDSILIRSNQAGARGSATQPVAMPSLSFDVTRMLLALVIVIGLIYLARWLLKRFYDGGTTPAGNKVVQVLNRTLLAPKQQVLLLQVGKRVIVVGESNGVFTTLSQIDDPDEIAQLVGRLHEEKSGRSSAFGGLFGHAQAKMADTRPDDEESRPAPGGVDLPAPEDEPKSELSSLLEKVRTIRNQMGRD